MKFNKCLLAASVAAIAASGAHASTLDVSGLNTDFTVASELLAANQNFSLFGGVVNKDIVYTPSFGLNAGDLITFTMTNALFMNGDVKLIASEADNAGSDIDNDGDGNDVVEVASNFGTLDSTNGVSSVTVRVNNGLVLPTGTILRLVEDGDQLNQDGANALVSNDNMDVRVPAGTAAGSSVTIAVTATNAANTTIGAAAATGDNTIIDVEQQIAISVGTAATSTIEITADSTSRKEFTEEGAANDVLTSANDSDELASSAVYSINNDSDNSVEVAYTVTANDVVTFSVTSTDTSGVTGVNVQTAGGDTANGANTDLTLSNGVYTGTRTGLPAQGAVSNDDIVVNVNGTDTLNERTWTTAFNINYSAATISDLSVAAATSHTWALDGGGAVLHTPMASLNSNFNQRITLSNRSVTSAPYSVTAIGEEGCTVTVNAGFLNGAASIPASSSVSIFARDVIDSVVCTGSNSTTRTSLTFDIEASNNDIQGISQQINIAAGEVTSSNYLIRNGTN